MDYIAHRLNTIDELKDGPTDMGVEVDIRTDGDGRLYIHHDAGHGADGTDWEEWMGHYNKKGPLILNVKEEGLEGRVLDSMKRHGVENFFFLDQSVPFLRKTVVDIGESRCAVRVSEIEPIEGALNLASMAKAAGKKIDWVWVDCFTKFPLNKDEYDQLKDAGFKLCLVSPDLQGRTDAHFITDMRQLLEEQGMEMDAVCAKVYHMDLWGYKPEQQAMQAQM